LFWNNLYEDLLKKETTKEKYSYIGMKFIWINWFWLTINFSHAGISRSSSCVIAFMMKEKGYSFHSAMYQVRLKRPIVCPNVGFQKQLMDYESTLRVNNCIHYDIYIV